MTSNRKQIPNRDEKGLDPKIDNQINDEVLEKVEGEMRQMLDREPSGVIDGAPHFTVISNGREVEINSPNRFRRAKRTITERERDLVDVANWYLRGMNHAQISAKLSAERPYDVKRTEVSMMIHSIYKRWQISYLTDINRLKVKELAKVDQIETEYWNAWEASKQDKLGIEQIKTEDQIPGGAADLRTSYKRTKTTTKKERRDPNFMFLQGIQWCVEQRCKIFGLNAPATLNINWRKQAEDAGISDPEKYVDGLTDEFIRLAQSPRGLEGSGLPGGLGEGSETPETD